MSLPWARLGTISLWVTGQPIIGYSQCIHTTPIYSWCQTDRQTNIFTMPTGISIRHCHCWCKCTLCWWSATRPSRAGLLVLVLYLHDSLLGLHAMSHALSSYTNAAVVEIDLSLLAMPCFYTNSRVLLNIYSRQSWDNSRKNICIVNLGQAIESKHQTVFLSLCQLTTLLANSPWFT